MAQFEKGQSGNEEAKFRTGKEQQEIARQGGIASGASRRKVKSLKEALSILLEQEHKSKTGEVKTGFEVIAIGLYKKAMQGDTKATKLLSELVGEYKHQTDITSGGVPFELKIVNTTPELKDKINDYLNGGGLNGEGV